MTLATSSCTTSELLDLQNGFCARAESHELACRICELIGQRSAAASTGGATKVGIAGQGALTCAPACVPGPICSPSAWLNIW